VVVIDGSVVSSAVAGHWQLARGLDDLGVLRVSPDLSLARERGTLQRASVDSRGLPLLDESHQWPLEEH